MRLAAPAKVNLSLHITGKRADGYHMLDSLVVFTDFGDVVEIHPDERLTLKISGPFAGNLSAHDNLVLKAARLLVQYAGKPLGARITLHKQIPVGAGLGGGSADAAAALRGLRDVWDIELDDTALAQMALALGSDLPVCLQAQPSWVSSIGEHIEPIRLETDMWIVLVNPGIPLPTAQVYKSYVPPHRQAATHTKRIGSQRELVDLVTPLHNDLQPAAFSLLPEIKNVLAMIAHTPNCLLVRMSGSGATCYGLYESEISARQAADAIKTAQPAWWIQETRIRRSDEAQ